MADSISRHASSSTSDKPLQVQQQQQDQQQPQPQPQTHQHQQSGSLAPPTASPLDTAASTPTTSDSQGQYPASILKSSSLHPISRPATPEVVPGSAPANTIHFSSGNHPEHVNMASVHPASRPAFARRISSDTLPFDDESSSGAASPAQGSLSGAEGTVTEKAPSKQISSLFSASAESSSGIDDANGHRAAAGSSNNSTNITDNSTSTHDAASASPSVSGILKYNAPPNYGGRPGTGPTLPPKSRTASSGGLSADIKPGYERRVGFDSMIDADETASGTFGFTLQVKSHGYQRTRNTRTFMCAVDNNHYSERALEWCMESLVEDNDEIVTITVLEGDPDEIDQEHARETAKELMSNILTLNEEYPDRKISIVVEFVAGRVTDTVLRLIHMYRPDSLTIGTRGRSVSTLQKLIGGPMIGGSSRDLLSRSPVPVVVVTPEAKVSKHLRQRQADPKRRSYHALVAQAKSEELPIRKGRRSLESPKVSLPIKASPKPTTAQQATHFYTTFTATLDSINRDLAQATTPQDLDAVLQSVVDARQTLHDQDIQGLVTNRDKEQYEKRLKELQNLLSSKRSVAPSSASSTKFSFRRPVKPSTPTPTSASSAEVKASQESQPPSAPETAAIRTQESSPDGHSAGVQITLQSQRLISFKDLPKAAMADAEFDGLSLSLSHLSECIVDFREAPRQVLAITATNLKHCVVLLPEIQGSVMLSGLQDSVALIQGCRQFRMYASKRTSIYLRSTSAVTIEACESLNISGLRAAELSLEPERSVASTAETTAPLEVQVQDFDAPSDGPTSVASKSWKMPTNRERAQLFTQLRAALISAQVGDSSWLKMLAALQGPPQLYRDDDAGVLLVFSDPGESVTREEFHDWYDNEHVPLRTKRFPEFRSAGRYEVYESEHAAAKDCKSFQAGWSAAYTISSNGLYNDPAYSRLRTSRSAREAELLSRIGVLDRRIYSLSLDSAAPRQPKGDLTPKKGSDVEREAQSLEFIGFDLPDYPEAQVLKWFSEKALPALREIGGVSRVRLLRLCDALVTGKWAGKENADGKRVPEWAVILEYTTSRVPDHAASQSARNASEVLQRGQNVEIRRMRLYRAWDAARALELDDPDAGASASASAS